MSQVNSMTLDVEEIYYNSPPGVLYQQALEHEPGSAIVSSGALAVKSGKKMGRSPLDTRPRLYVVDGYAGWEEAYRVPVRVITSRAYHALFMQNMLVPPKESELVNFQG